MASLELDLCPRCQLVWFDPEELERLGIKLPGEPSPEFGRVIAAAQAHAAQLSREARDEALFLIAALVGIQRALGEIFAGQE